MIHTCSQCRQQAESEGLPEGWEENDPVKGEKVCDRCRFIFDNPARARQAMARISQKAKHVSSIADSMARAASTLGLTSMEQKFRRIQRKTDPTVNGSIGALARSLSKKKDE